MTQRINELRARLRDLQERLDARIHSIAWRTFRPQPWENPIHGGFRSDPTYAAVEFLENDPLYQLLKREYRATKHELDRLLAEHGVRCTNHSSVDN